MASQYKQKKADLASKIAERTLPDLALLEGLLDRFCSPPFSRKLGSFPFWMEAWEHLSPEARAIVAELPTPCLNHVESRDRKEERSVHLRAGLIRLLTHDEKLFLNGLKLFPHELCRSSETIGPLGDQVWTNLIDSLTGHRLWQLSSTRNTEEFWEAAEQLRSFRDLPQPLLDYLDSDREKDEAPLDEFQASLATFLLRKKIEKVRTETYKTLRVHDQQNALRIKAKG